MNFEDRFRPTGDIACREVGGEYVLLHLESGIYFGLDNVGSRIWSLLQEKPQTLVDLGNTLHEEYEVDRSKLDADLRALFRDLLAQGLIEIDA